MLSDGQVLAKALVVAVRLGIGDGFILVDGVPLADMIGLSEGLTLLEGVTGGEPKVVGHWKGAGV